MISASSTTTERPLSWIFFSHAYNYGDTSRAIEVALAVRASGATVKFFHRGGAFASKIAEAGLEPTAIEPLLTEEQNAILMDMDQHRAPLGTLLPFSEAELQAMVESELELFRRLEPDGVYCGLNLSALISVAHAAIPKITLVPTALCPAFYRQGLASFPDAMNSRPLRWLVPEGVKRTLINRIMLGKVAKKSAAIYNRVRNEYGLPPVYNFPSLVRGDLTLLPDLPELSGLPADLLPPGYAYSGPLFARPAIPLPEGARRVFHRDGPKIYCAMGSSGTPALLRDIVRILRSRPEHNVVCATTNLLDPAELGPVDERFFAAEFLPAPEINELADVAVIHGGQGTVQTAVWSGTPVVGVGMQWEQQANLEALERAGAGIRLPLWNVSPASLLGALDTAMQPSYRERMKELQRAVRASDGAAEAARQMNAFVARAREASPRVRP